VTAAAGFAVTLVESGVCTREEVDSVVRSSFDHLLAIVSLRRASANDRERRPSTR
jgi:hypothetical protein